MLQRCACKFNSTSERFFTFVKYSFIVVGMLDSRRLQVFTTVVSTGSMAAAAEVLGYTASAISQSVAALERETGTVLVEKSGRGIRPTQAGLLLAEHADGVVAKLREAEAALQAFAAGEAGRLRLAAFSTAGAGLIPRAMARFRAGHAAVELDLSVAEDDEAIAQLRAGHIDVALIALDEPVDTGAADDLQWTHVLADPYRVILPHDHPLAGRKTVALSDLSGDSWVATSSPRCNVRQVVAGACTEAGFSPRFDIEAQEFATVVGFVGAGLGVALVPLLALGAVPDSVRVRRLRGHEPVRHVFALARTSNAEDPIVTAMVDALQISAHGWMLSAA